MGGSFTNFKKVAFMPILLMLIASIFSKGSFFKIWALLFFLILAVAFYGITR